ncbi:lactate dehydrogenase-like 2-hydroxyacid dehydrogenase [Pacificibacter maritimus]|uniref:Lactate dehydrogenase-like 2-hydroxyacid dehydrogenase n=1 Tax=Pacificibacter maritimus TaxID=762213 RepID=A0A3N4V0E6_9RHOB|nr:D-glycerate dehydrogenase [Pacificibacter maritimus]RPE66394.1 lactate dehydrogenase-like 2-hydroxyacid dehydrogenase [Pacificibacter maritimus]
MKLLVTQSMPETVEAELSAHFDTTFRAGGAMRLDEARQAMKDYDAILLTLGDQFSTEAFEGNLRCKALVNFGVGFNHIDVAAAKAAGMQVSNTPGAVTDATADIAMMLILMTARRASEGEALLRSGDWTGWAPTQLLGLHVTGKTLGVIGMGRIGKAIAKRCHFGFDMNVVCYNRSEVQEFDVPCHQLDSIEEVMEHADIVVLALPATPATHHIIGAAQLSAMQKHAVLVNIARGDIIDESALIDALQNGVIAGAGLDVYEHEPHVPQALIDLPNCSLLPHLGTAALEVRRSMGAMVIENLHAFVAQKSLPNAL